VIAVGLASCVDTTDDAHDAHGDPRHSFVLVVRARADAVFVVAAGVAVAGVVAAAVAAVAAEADLWIGMNQAFSFVDCTCPIFWKRTGRNRP
jgi:hypothetical protein